MSGRFLLDTNIIVALFASDKAVQDRLITSNEVLVSAIVIGELCYGAAKSAKHRANLARIDLFRQTVPAVSCDADTGKYYGLVKERLRLKGRPIPENDLWIAATALQHNLTLVTRDQHFTEVDTLSLVAW